MVTMSQKSSLLQPANSVSQVLIPDKRRLFLTLPSSPIIIVGMHPRVRRDLTLLRQLDHVNGRCVSPLLASPAFQRRLKIGVSRGRRIASSGMLAQG